MQKALFAAVFIIFSLVYGPSSAQQSAIATPYFKPDAPVSYPKEVREGVSYRILAEDFEFFDGQASWIAKAGDETDGASIPWQLWTLTGFHPMDVRLERAALLHDQYCKVGTTRTWPSVHRMFYDALMATPNGVKSHVAKALYYAVYAFGPRWNIVQEQICTIDSECHIAIQAVDFVRDVTTIEIIRRAYEEMLKRLERQDMSLTNIARMADADRIDYSIRVSSHGIDLPSSKQGNQPTLIETIFDSGGGTKVKIVSPPDPPDRFMIFRRSFDFLGTPSAPAQVDTSKP